MIASKFGIGQQVRHSLLGYLGVVVDIRTMLSESLETAVVLQRARGASQFHRGLRRMVH